MSRQRICLFSRYIARTYALPQEDLISVVRGRDWALSNLKCNTVSYKVL